MCKAYFPWYPRSTLADGSQQARCGALMVRARGGSSEADSGIPFARWACSTSLNCSAVKAGKRSCKARAILPVPRANDEQGQSPMRNAERFHVQWGKAERIPMLSFFGMPPLAFFPPCFCGDDGCLIQVIGAALCHEVPRERGHDPIRPGVTERPHLRCPGLEILVHFESPRAVVLARQVPFRRRRKMRVKASDGTIPACASRAKAMGKSSV